jgi:hypothetical protein
MLQRLHEQASMCSIKYSKVIWAGVETPVKKVFKQKRQSEYPTALRRFFQPF